MNYGLYISTSGALNAVYRQDLLTANLANVNTAGFKADMPFTRQRDPARIEDGLGYLPSSDLIERLGAGVMGARTRTIFEQGSIRTTGNGLDLAIRGRGFFTLLDEQDTSGAGLRLTRDGRFTLDRDGRVVSAASALPVLGDDGRAIRLDPTRPVTIMGDGAILQDGEEMARLDFVEVPAPDSLQKRGDGQFVATPDQLAAKQPATGLIEQHAVEDSSVDEIDTLMDIEAAARDAQANLGMIAYHDRLLDQAINRFARLS